MMAAEDHPGRWVGGVAGVAAAVSVGVVGAVLHLLGAIDGESIVQVAVAGLPVGFVVGRHFLPFARSSGWRQALLVGGVVGWLAPPIGAIVVLIAMAWPGEYTEYLCTPRLHTIAGVIALYPLAAIFSFVAVVVTLPAGLAWGVMVRAIPERTLIRARMPGPVAALGVRHGVIVVAIGAVVLLLVDALVTTRACEMAMAGA